MLHVSDVDRSLEFYALLGFNCHSRFSDHTEKPYYAAIQSQQAELMLARASGPIDPAQQAVLLYMYCKDVVGLRSHLLAQGLLDAGPAPSQSEFNEQHLKGLQNTPKNSSSQGSLAAVFNVTFPDYMNEGEVRIHDPDGYIILVGQHQRNRKQLGPGSIGQIAITVSDVSQATEFYRDVIGFTLLFSAVPNLAFLSDGAIRIMLSTPQGAGQVGVNSILYIRTHDIVSSCQQMVERGAKLEREPQFAAPLASHDLWIGFVRDPDGNLVGLMEEKLR
jgi:predicted enzyme related to lactoylglutathione lyase